MANLLKGITERPIATLGIVGFISFAATVISGWLFLDTRYVHAQEFRKYAAQQVVQLNNFQRSLAKNELFKLELIPPEKRSDSDRAMIEMYKRQLIEINEATRNGRAAD